VETFDDGEMFQIVDVMISFSFVEGCRVVSYGVSFSILFLL
jgi:hypothetical protein